LSSTLETIIRVLGLIVFVVGIVLLVINIAKRGQSYQWSLPLGIKVELNAAAVIAVFGLALVVLPTVLDKIDEDGNSDSTSTSAAATTAADGRGERTCRSEPSAPTARPQVTAPS
jgi:hypothetical protein